MRRRKAAQSTTLRELFCKYGVPYYLKCDIDGADDICVKQLLAEHRRPAFISTEAISVDVFGLLLACGYDRFQVINQALHPYTKCPESAREGKYVDQHFSGLMTGLFGHELDAGGWKTFHEVVQTYCDFIRLTQESSIGLTFMDQLRKRYRAAEELQSVVAKAHSPGRKFLEASGAPYAAFQPAALPISCQPEKAPFLSIQSTTSPLLFWNRISLVPLPL